MHRRVDTANAVRVSKNRRLEGMSDPWKRRSRMGAQCSLSCGQFQVEQSMRKRDMKIEVLLEGYIPASVTFSAEVPDDIREEELDAIKEDLRLGELEGDSTPEITHAILGDIVPDDHDIEVRLFRDDGQLL